MCVQWSKVALGIFSDFFFCIVKPMIKSDENKANNTLENIPSLRHSYPSASEDYGGGPPAASVAAASSQGPGYP